MAINKPKSLSRTKSPKYNILVVRVNHLGGLEDSKPCIMCIYLMRLYGIYRVYYSNSQGHIVCRKLDEMASTETWMSIGVDQMKSKWGSDLKTFRLPLNKRQKRQLLGQSE